MEAVGGPHGAGTEGALRARAPTQKVEREGGLPQKRPSAVKTRRKLAQGDSSPPSGTLPSSAPNKGPWAGLQLEWSRTLGGLPGRDPTPPRGALS